MYRTFDIAFFVFVCLELSAANCKAVTVASAECTCNKNAGIIPPGCGISYWCDRLDGPITKVTAGTQGRSIGAAAAPCDNCPPECLNPPEGFIPTDTSCQVSCSVSYTETYSFDIQIGGSVEWLKVGLNAAIGGHYEGQTTYQQTVTCGSNSVPACTKGLAFAAELTIFNGGKAQMVSDWRWMDQMTGPNPPCTRNPGVNADCGQKTSTLVENYYSGAASCTTTHGAIKCN
jgi:hypothetical protein